MHNELQENWFAIGSTTGPEIEIIVMILANKYTGKCYEYIFPYRIVREERREEVIDKLPFLHHASILLDNVQGDEFYFELFGD